MKSLIKTHAKETEIRSLEKQYTSGLKQGEVFEVLKTIRKKIKELKTQINEQRDKNFS
jgi:flagellar biosynthesis regulator FlbT